MQEKVQRIYTTKSERTAPGEKKEAKFSLQKIYQDSD